VEAARHVIDIKSINFDRRMFDVKRKVFFSFTPENGVLRKYKSKFIFPPQLNRIFIHAVVCHMSRIIQNFFLQNYFTHIAYLFIIDKSKCVVQEGL
jgi:hypothetical protein